MPKGKRKEPSDEVQIGVVAIIVGLVGIGISIALASYTLVQPATPELRSIFAVVLDIFAGVVFLIVIKIYWSNRELIRGLVK